MSEQTVQIRLPFLPLDENDSVLAEKCCRTQSCHLIPLGDYFLLELKKYLLVKYFLGSFISVEAPSGKAAVKWKHLWKRQHESTFVEEFVILIKLVLLFHLLS